jgi:hypothetical protein
MRRFVLVFVLSLFLLPSLALSKPPTNAPTAQEIYARPITSQEAPWVAYLVKWGKNLPWGRAEQIVRAVRAYGGGERLLLAIMMVESEGDVNARTDDKHGLMGISEIYLKKEPFKRDLSTCGASSVDDLYDIRISMCAVHKIIGRLFDQYPDDPVLAMNEYGGPKKVEGYDDRVREYSTHFRDLAGIKK